MRKVELGDVVLEIPLQISENNTTYVSFYGEVLSFYFQQALFSELDKYRNQPIEIIVKDVFISIINNEEEVEKIRFPFTSITYSNEEQLIRYDLSSEALEPDPEDFSLPFFVNYFQEVCTYMLDERNIQLTFSGISENLSETEVHAGVLRIKPVIEAIIDLKGYIENENTDESNSSDVFFTSGHY